MLFDLTLCTYTLYIAVEKITLIIVLYYDPISESYYVAQFIKCPNFLYNVSQVFRELTPSLTMKEQIKWIKWLL